MNGFGYREDNKTYFGRFHIKGMIFVALGLMLFTQLFTIIWYLVFQDWWWFLGLACLLLGNGLLFMSVRLQNQQLVFISLVYEVMCVVICMSCTIYMVILVCHPYSDSPFFRYYMNVKKNKSWKYSVDECVNKVRLLAGIFSAIFTIFGIINLFCCTIIYNYYCFMAGMSVLVQRPEPKPASQPTPAASNPAPRPEQSAPAPASSSFEQFPPPTTPSAALKPNFSTETRPVFNISSSQEARPFGEYSSQQESTYTAIQRTQEVRNYSENSLQPDWDSQPSFSPYQGPGSGAPPLPPHSRPGSQYYENSQQY